MAEKFYSILTNIGKAKIANSIGLGTKVNFVTMKIGDGGGAYYEPTEDQTDLKNTVWQGNINHVEIDENNPNWIHIEVMIPSDVGGFTIREYGAFDEEGNMLGICKCAETYKPVIADGSTKELLLNLILAVSNTESITLKIDPTIIFAKKSDVEQLRTDITTQLSDLTSDRIYYCGTTSGTNTYTAANNKIIAYTEGLTVRVKIGIASTGASTLNINGLGAKPILDSLGNAITSGGLKAGLPYQLCYNGTNFIVLGKGGGGDAIAANLLLNKKATVDSGPIVGAMPENGSPNVALNAGQSYSLAQGHYGGGTITANSLASQTSATADASKIATGYSAWVNGNLVNGNYDPLTLVAGDGLVLYKNSAVSTSNQNYTVLDSKTVYGHGGTVRIKFSIACAGSSSGVVGYSRIYVNGSPRGTERSASGTTSITFTEDISINAGDVIQLYAHPSSGGYGETISNYTISCGNNYAYLS